MRLTDNPQDAWHDVEVSLPLPLAGPMLLGPAAQLLGLSYSQARRVLDAAGVATRDSSGRRVVPPEVLSELIAQRAARRSAR